MCQYCNYSFHDGWTRRLEYDDLHRSAVGDGTDATHGFHDPWDEPREAVY